MIQKEMLTNLALKKRLWLWVTKIRRLGGLVFFVGVGPQISSFLQVVIKEKKLIRLFSQVSIGYLLKVSGTFQKKKDSEDWELEADKLVVISTSKTLPFSLQERPLINEDTKYRYRYLDLRVPMNRNYLAVKSNFFYLARVFFHRRGFSEVDTPLLSQFSPEGAKAFFVSSPLKGRYYSLPQSPQIYKQLLMVGGIGKYYQLAKSFRNEGARSNRQIEFLQLDVELSFTSSKKLQKLIENFLKMLIPRLLPDVSWDISFLSFSYKKVIEDYKTDKPDLRKNKEDRSELCFVWITDWPLFGIKEGSRNCYESLRHPFTSPVRQQIKPLLTGKIKPEEVMADAFDLVCNGEEIVSGGMRIHQRQLQELVFSYLGYDKKDILTYFGYFLDALDFAPPPHGGFGLGVERFLAKLLAVRSIKEMIAFPKNSDGTCSLTGTPDISASPEN